ncbi:GAF and ANTAR domain-containing protein [Actinocorallia sp. A-T 12471]|uniref:GAF and ANTAR domain-containing protein n=1 Tax=Actinocorallia sp. A-T 12471 TaxID=3089813 RepID=UPI0029CEFF98|nr:GAF and ANTAR domain-containing protein [Actinocorallia sp. A-T 12471]MDX6742656.1 GAF and ANTAR domain-containing protein [Actinocorallia sp. A-T 12471]
MITDCAGAEAVTAEHVCRAATAALAADGAVLWLATQADRRKLVYATDPVARRLDDRQFVLGEGPCVRAWTVGELVLASDLTSDASAARWPLFAPAAVTAGAGALFAFPLRVGAIRLGALGLYRAKPGPLTDGQLADGLTFASAATGVVLAATQPTTSGAQPTWWFDEQGEDWTEVYQATGMVAAQLNASLEVAFVRLRAHAFTTEESLVEIARQVVARTLRLSP